MSFLFGDVYYFLYLCRKLRDKRYDLFDFDYYPRSVWRGNVVGRDVSAARFWFCRYLRSGQFGGCSGDCLYEAYRALGMGRACDPGSLRGALRHCRMGIHQEQSHGQDGP